jgi:hypothetical protein
VLTVGSALNKIFIHNNLIVLHSHLFKKYDDAWEHSLVLRNLKVCTDLAGLKRLFSSRLSKSITTRGIKRLKLLFLATSTRSSKTILDAALKEMGRFYPVRSFPAQ